VKRALLLFLLVSTGAGCSDNQETLSREYRNLNNEAIDSLMLTTSERRARLANEKIFGRYSERLQEIDRRFKIWETNADERMMTIDVLTSESVITLMAENKTNQDRLAIETARLSKLLRDMTEQERNRRQELGENPAFDTKEVWPNLHELVSTNRTKALNDQLTKGGNFAALLAKMANPAWKYNPPPDIRKALDENFTSLFKKLSDR